MATDAVSAIPEHEASGEVAEIYADIRATLGVTVVNLIWRHLATIEGGLPWAWATVKPLYTSGLVEAEARRLIDSLTFPDLPMLHADVLRAAGVEGSDLETIRAILATYNRGNALNMLTLTALSVDPIGAAEAPDGGASPVPLPPVPRVPELSEIPAERHGLIMQLNTLGGEEGDRIIASLYKHLSPWPGLLLLTWGLFAPLHREGVLEAAIGAARAAGRMHAARIAGGLGAPDPSPAADAVRAAAEEFTNRAIARMIPIAQMLDRALPPS